jgi:hypothetical protein
MSLDVRVGVGVGVGVGVRGVLYVDQNQKKTYRIETQRNFLTVESSIVFFLFLVNITQHHAPPPAHPNHQRKSKYCKHYTHVSDWLIYVGSSNHMTWIIQSTEWSETVVPNPHAYMLQC